MKFIRMVIQLPDTELNREVVGKVESFASSFKTNPGTGSVIKIESVTMDSIKFNQGTKINVEE